MSETDRHTWNDRYRERGVTLREPASFLVSLDTMLPRTGRALDVGGGTGRNAIWLGRRGLEVTVVDISEVGLELAAAEARAAGMSLRTIAADLDHEPLPPGPWDIIVDFHFLHRPLFAEIARELAPGGYFVFVQPTMSNLQRHSHPSARYLLEDGELSRLISSIPSALEVIDFREGWSSEGRHEASLLARRPAH